MPVSMFSTPEMPTVCDVCMRGRDMKATKAAIAVKTKAVAAELADVDTDSAVGLAKLRETVAGVYKEFGGPSNYASHFHFLIMELSKRRPLPTGVGQLMLNFLRLHHAVEQTEEAISAREMTDEQLKRETELATLRMVVAAAANPDQRKVLEGVFLRHGLEIREADPDRLMHKVAEHLEDSDEPGTIPPVDGRAGEEAEGDSSCLADIEAAIKDLSKQS